MLIRFDETRDFWEIRWYDPPSWIAHAAIHLGGFYLFRWAEFTPYEIFALLIFGFAVWYTREECQGWSFDGIMDLVGPLVITILAYPGFNVL